MIDHERRFIHVHIQRCAGTSIEQFFNFPYRYDHRKPEDYIDQYGEGLWNDYYKFAVIRNPWAKVVSHYFWRQQRAWWYAPGDELEFKEWVKNFQDFKEHLGDKNLPQVEWITSDGQWLVDDVIKLNELNESWEDICNHIGVEYKSLPRNNETSHKHYSYYYDDETKQIVADWYKPDLKVFGFDYNAKD